MNRWQRVRLECWWVLCRFVAILPYFVQYYVLQEIMYVVLRVVRYRYGCITENLSYSFPEKSRNEICTIRRRFYRHLAEMVINTIVQARMTPGECRRRMKFVNHEEIASQLGDRPCIAFTSHFGCWEYYGFWGMWLPRHTLVAAYHKLHDPIADELCRRLRCHPCEMPVAAPEALRFFVRHLRGYEGRNLVLGLVADQNPPRYAESRRYRFLNRDTLFFEGAGRLAVKYGLPVLYARQRKVRRGYYEAELEWVYDGETALEPHVITERYVGMLEKDIKQCPELWIWSHRRWKQRRDVASRPNKDIKR